MLCIEELKKLQLCHMHIALQTQLLKLILLKQPIVVDHLLFYAAETKFK
jgi:hypothetical protein